MRFTRSRAALLAIDLQRAFCAAEGSIARQGRDIRAMAAAAQRACQLAEAAQSVDIPVVWTMIDYADDYADGGLLIHELRPNLARIGALKRGSADAQLIDGIVPVASDLRLSKQRYSAFVGTGLMQWLAERRIDCLMVCGVTTSMCVESTVREAAQLDLRCFVVADACADFDPNRHNASLAAMDFGFARVIDMKAALDALAQASSEPPGGAP